MTVGSGDLDLLDLMTLSGGEPRGGAYTGTKALMVAVLEDGIRSYLSPVARVRAEAECWIGARRHRSPFSFGVVCETLGLQPDAVRAALRRLRAHRVSPRRAVKRTRPNVRRPGRLVVRKV